MSDTGVATASSRRTLATFFAFSLLFVAPKLFFVDYTADATTDMDRWAYIIIADLVPASLIAWWVWCYAGRSSTRHPIKTSGPDPLLTLRFVACMVVVFGHYFGVVFAPPSGPAVQPHFVSRLLMSSPWAGVWMFFVLSGYLMGKAFFSERYSLDAWGVADFIWNRAFRIVPVYAFALLVVMVFVRPQSFEIENLWIPAQVILMDYNGYFPINIIGALWSVSTEFQFYLLAPLIALLIIWIDRRWGARYWMLAAVVVTGAAINIARAVTMNFDLLLILHRVYSSIGANLFLFAAGMLLAKLRQNAVPKSQRTLAWGCAALLSTLVIQTLLASYMSFFGTNLAQYIIFVPPLVAVGTLATIALFESARIEGALSNLIRWTQLGGTLTYCIYVLHSDVMLAIRKIAPAVIGLADQTSYAPLVFGLTLIFSYMVYLGVEKPAARLKR